MFPFNIFDFMAFGAKRLKSEREKLIEELAPYRDQLIPWDKEEMSLISYTISEGKTYKDQYGKGLFVSIYDEPLMSFGFKAFGHKKMNRITMVETGNHHMLYLDKHSHIDCYFNNQLVGLFRKPNLFYSPRKRLLGRINDNGGGDYKSVIYKDKELASINPIETDPKFNKRIFDLLKSNISREEQVILMTMSFYFLLQEMNNFK